MKNTTTELISFNQFKIQRGPFWDDSSGPHIGIFKPSFYLVDLVVIVQIKLSAIGVYFA